MRHLSFDHGGAGAHRADRVNRPRRERRPRDRRPASPPARPAALLAALGLAAVLVAAPWSGGLAESEEEAFVNRIMTKIQQYSANPETAKLGPLMGLWRNSGGGVESVYHLGDVFVESAVDPQSGGLTPVGFAEQSEGGWRGWFRTSCKGCCPGLHYWGKGAAAGSGKEGVIRLVIDGRKIDPDRCVKTDVPERIEDTLSLVYGMRFKELLPGKYVHVVAVPQVGGQAPQYKASVTVQWDYTGTGIGLVSLGVQGPGYGHPLFQKRAGAAGEYEFISTRSGKHTFKLAAYNKDGRPLHVELLSIVLPAIPGIGG